MIFEALLERVHFLLHHLYIIVVQFFMMFLKLLLCRTQELLCLVRIYNSSIFLGHDFDM